MVKDALAMLRHLRECGHVDADVLAAAGRLWREGSRIRHSAFSEADELRPSDFDKAGKDAWSEAWREAAAF